MKVSAKGEYAYRAVYELACNHGDAGETVIQLEQIARNQGIPKKYLVQILLQLKRAGLVGTLRGVKGGYFLRKPPSQITLGEVLELIEGPFVPVSRGGGGQGERTNDVLLGVIGPVLDEVRSMIHEILYDLSFEEICRRAQLPKEQMYYI